NDVADFGPDVVKNLAGDFRNAPVMKFLHTLNNAEKPIVAGVNGLAVGVAVTMLLHCDLVYAAPSASFTIPFTKLGIVPEAASSLLLPRVIGYPKAADMLLRCRMMTAEEADAAGLLSEILHEEDFRSAVLDRAGDLADKAPEALKITKAMMKKNRPEIAERIDYEAEFFLERLHSAEVAEAVAAFFEKRKPDFRKSG
ncbi:MAG: enoyl-CoA hydratase-related protein, partial [Pseudomonadota bacterium]